MNILLFYRKICIFSNNQQSNIKAPGIGIFEEEETAVGIQHAHGLLQDFADDVYDLQRGPQAQARHVQGFHLHFFLPEEELSLPEFAGQPLGALFRR
ncbi:MAG: hypothetical protein QGH15_22360 [Kiritimatiellia bacterium]|nr:hypothetical protein [Kiritimatiellia bacterium]